MKYRDLGTTGLRVSEIGFGTIPILSGNVPVLPGYYSPDTEGAVAVMEHAWRLGCNLYDTAIVPEYGDAELKLGAFAKKIGRDKIVISDKARFYTGNEMYQAVLESTENLGTAPDIYISCDRCQRCTCPHGTEIHTVFRQYHYFFLGKDYWALRKLDLGIEESAAACRSCTSMSCIKQCPHKLRIPEIMQQIERLTKIHIRNSVI